jgi:hypothetical protein
VHRQGEQGGEGTPKWNTSAGGCRDHDSAIHQHAQAGRQKKERENNSETQSSATFHKAKYSQEVQSSMIDSQAKYERVCYMNSKERKLQEKANSTPPQQQAPWR